MKLIIVESPNKCNKIRQLAGPGYKVMASFGHVRDLPVSGGDLHVAFRDGHIIPNYTEVKREGFKSPVPDLQAAARQCDEVLLASDPDREGEAIAWHLTQVIGPHRYQRVRFHSITEDAVRQALASPTPIDDHLVNAQQARRVLDRVVGWLGSSVVRQGMGKEARSAGRVQSAALRIVVDRERDIHHFVPTDFFTLRAHLEAPGQQPSFWAAVTSFRGTKIEKGFRVKGDADAAAAACLNATWSVTSSDRREEQRRPPPPYMTSSLLQAASVAFQWRPEQTMKIAQTLFEDGHITYMRTDSVALAPEAIAAARAYIGQHFAPAYLPEKAHIYGTKQAHAQEAHEAIRPTHPETGPDAAGGEESGHLYRLIWQRFMACQMANANDAITTIHVAAGSSPTTPIATLVAKGKTSLFDGWRVLTATAAEDDTKQAKRKRGQVPDTDDEESAEEEDVRLPSLKAGQLLRLQELAIKKSTTQPPSRYTQASLIKKLEHDGIGRPSTFASILRTLLDRRYVREERRKLVATDVGMQLVDFLMRHFQGNFIDLTYTATMERTLDDIAAGKEAWEVRMTEAVFQFAALTKAAGLPGDPLTESGSPGAPQELPQLPPNPRLRPCEGCGADIGFVTVNGRWVAVNVDSSDHRSTCTGNSKTRSKRSGSGGTTRGRRRAS